MDNFKPQIIAFCCSNCASAAVGVANGMGKAIPDNIKIIQIPCTGRIETLHLLKPFESGADAVYVAGCQEDSCKYITGILKAKKRVEQVKKILEEIDIEPERIGIYSLYAGKGYEFIEAANEMTKKAQELGPLFQK